MRRFKIDRWNWITVCLLTFLASVDFFSRVAVFRNEPPTLMSWVQVKMPKMEPSRGEILSRVSQWVPFDNSRAESTLVPADALVVVAIVVNQSDRKALLALRGPDGQITRYVRVVAGDEVEGWVVQEIHRRKVSLRRESATHEAVLFKQPSPIVGGG